MLQCACLGAVIFHKNLVLLLHNEKQEWLLPKAPSKKGVLVEEQLKEMVKSHTGLQVEISDVCGKTHFTRYSVSRRREISNDVTWYLSNLVETYVDSPIVIANPEFHYDNGGFYPIEAAMEMLTFQQDRYLLMLAYQKYFDLDR